MTPWVLHSLWTFCTRAFYTSFLTLWLVLTFLSLKLSKPQWTAMFRSCLRRCCFLTQPHLDINTDALMSLLFHTVTTDLITLWSLLPLCFRAAHFPLSGTSSHVMCNCLDHFATKVQLVKQQCLYGHTLPQTCHMTLGGLSHWCLVCENSMLQPAFIILSWFTVNWGIGCLC